MGHPNIIFVGPMGAGKTTIGRMVADSLNMSFHDVDHSIEQRAGADIPWIFDLEGEAGFRRRETAMLAELLQTNGRVIATGGGAVLAEENRRILKDNGWVVCLQASVETQLRRTEQDRNRPLLQRPDREQVLRQMKRQRDPLYRAVASLTLDTDKRRPRQLAQQIVEAFQHDCSAT